MLIETNVEVNLRSIEEFTRVMLPELLDDAITYNITTNNKNIEMKVYSKKLNKLKIKENDRYE